MNFIENYQNLNKNTLGKLKIILFILFPEFKNIKVSKDKKVLFIPNGIWPFRKVICRSLPEVLVIDIPRRISIRNWNSEGLISHFSTEITKIIQQHYNSEVDNIIEVINYLYENVSNNGSDLSSTTGQEDTEVEVVVDITHNPLRGTILEDESPLVYFIDYIKSIIYNTKHRVIVATLSAAISLSIATSANETVVQKLLQYLYIDNHCCYYFDST